MNQTVSIVIPTFNRRQELEATLEEIHGLSPAATEIIVFLDGCTDGSSRMLADRWPEVIVLTSDTPTGSIPTRDIAFRTSTCDLIVSLDDDSYPLQQDFIRRLINLAEARPEAGAFAFRQIRPDGAQTPLSRTHEPKQAWISTYPNCAGAIRKEIYGETTRYPRFFSHAYAEPDFCLQAYGSGWGVLYVPEIEIFHRFTHTQRDMKARHHRNARNEFWSVIMRCPLPHVLWVGSYRIIRQVAFAASQGWAWLKDEPKWLIEAFGQIRKPLAERQPVSWAAYWRWMRMARHPMPGDADTLKRAFPKVKSRMATFPTASKSSEREFSEER